MMVHAKQRSKSSLEPEYRPRPRSPGQNALNVPLVCAARSFGSPDSQARVASLQPCGFRGRVPVMQQRSVPGPVGAGRDGSCSLPRTRQLSRMFIPPLVHHHSLTGPNCPLPALKILSLSHNLQKPENRSEAGRARRPDGPRP